MRDGHHRVSVAKSLGRQDIDAYVVEIQTRVRLGRDLRVGDLPLKDHERLFRERVPLGREERARISVTDPWDYGALAEAVEAWGFRAMQDRGAYMDRARGGAPVVRRGVRAGGRDARRRRADRARRDGDRRLPARGRERYRALRTHEWSDEVLEELRRRRSAAPPAPPAAGPHAAPQDLRSGGLQPPAVPGP